MSRTRAAVDRVLREGFANEDSPLYHKINFVIVTLILISVVSVIFGSVQPIYERYAPVFDASELIIVTFFSAEYLINIYVAKDRRRYIFGVWGIIDLLAILPSILLMFDLRALKVARVLRVMRFLRLLRILRVLKLMKVAARQYEKRKDAGLNTLKLDLQIYVIAFLSALVILSTLTFYAEEQVPNTAFTSIPASMWWCIVTLTTTGYGDMVPATVAGRIIAGVTMLVGLALFGMLMSVVGKAMLSSLFGSSDLERHSDADFDALPHAERQGVRRAPSKAERVPADTCACGQSLAPDWNLCPHCGTRLRAEPDA